MDTSKEESCDLTMMDDCQSGQIDQCEKRISDEAQKKSWSLEDFVILRPLRFGEFGEVFLARDKLEGVTYEVQIIYKKHLAKRDMGHILEREFEIQSNLRHPNILHMYAFFHNEHSIYMVLENAAGGELAKLMQKQPNNRFENPLSARYISQIADALIYCHQNNIIHGYIKPGNLLLSGAGDIKIADFGLSVHSSLLVAKIAESTISYTAPEIISGNKFDHTVDIWSVGVLCYELLAGYPPFYSPPTKELLETITARHFFYPNHFNNLAKDLIFRLLQFEPEKRLCLTEVLQHPWTVKFKRLDDEERLI